MKSPVYLFLSALLTLSLSACKTDRPSSQSVSEPGQAKACVQTTFSKNIAEAGDIIRINGTNKLEGIYFVENGKRTALARNANAFSIPATQLLSLKGGIANIEVKQNGGLCAMPALQVTPLPAAPDDTYTELLDTFDTALKNLESMLGYDPSKTSLNDAQNDPLLATAYWLHNIYYDPKSEFSLAYQRKAMTTLSKDEQQHIARVIQKLGLIEDMRDFAKTAEIRPFQLVNNNAVQAKAIVSEDSDALNRNKHAPAFSTSDAVINPARLRQKLAAKENCTNRFNDPKKYKVNISNMKDLSTAMKVAHMQQTKQNNAALKAKADANRNTVVNIALTTASLSEKLNLPLAAFSAINGLINLKESAGEAMLAKLLPSKITDVNLIVIPKNRLEEDFTEKFNNPSWDMTVQAKSQGYNLAKVVSDSTSILQGLPNGVANPFVASGFSEVSGRVSSDLQAQDCRLYVPPLSWSNIPVDTSYIEASINSGDSFEVEKKQSKVIIPTKIGVSELKVKLIDSQFPSFSNTLGDFQATQRIENIQKNIVFSNKPIVVKQPGQRISVDVTLHNSVLPEKHRIKKTVGLLIGKTRSGNTLTLETDTPSDPKLYPQRISVSSLSKSLAPSGDRESSVLVTLDESRVTVLQTKSGQCSNQTYAAEYQADVTSVLSNDKSVSWKAAGATITPLADNKVRFEAPSKGSYVLTATSNADADVSKSVTINVPDCKNQMYLNALVKTDKIGVPDACNPDDTKDKVQESKYGVFSEEALTATPANIDRKMQRFSSGKAFTYQADDKHLVSTSVQTNQGCQNKVLNGTAISSGQLLSEAENTIRFNTSHTVGGACVDTEFGRTCGDARVDEMYQFAWVFDHQSAKNYKVVHDLVCSKAVPAGFDTKVLQINLIYTLRLFDSAGADITQAYYSKVNQQELEDKKPLSIPAFETGCSTGNAPGTHKGFNIADMPSGSSVIITGSIVNFLANTNIQSKPWNVDSRVNGTINIDVK